MLGVLYTQEEPRGGNQSEGTLAGDQRGEERKQCKGRLLQLASLCMVTWKVTDPIQRDFKACVLDGNFIYPNAEGLETS